MSVSQPSLWDNVSLENGYRLFSALALPEAIKEFNGALHLGKEDQEAIHAAIAACKYWQTRIQPSTDTTASAGTGASPRSILGDYIQYPFTPKMTAFRKALLRHISDLLRDAGDLDFKTTEIVFDQLLGTRDYEKAKELIAQSIGRHPEAHQLPYLLAQAHWLSGDKPQAGRRYALALLHHPYEAPVNRIEPEGLKEIIQTFGRVKAAAYGWIHDILPLIPVTDDLKVLDEEHRQALESYALLLEVQKSLSGGDKKESIRSRKKLKRKDAVLFEAYFNRRIKGHL
jgi:hypothetical protein